MAGFDIVDDFDKFAITRLEDVPKPIEREFAKTKSVKEVPNIITFKNITTKVQDYEIKKGTFIKADFVMF